MSGVLVIVGGSSPFTVALVDALACDPLAGCERLVLHGRDAAALDDVRRYARRRLGGASAVAATTDLDGALAGADVVVHQIRYGGLAGRARDGALAALAGVAADETLGPAGLAAALRTYPATLRTGRAIAARCPDAWVVNLTNPVGPAIAALRAAGVQRAVGVCELPQRTATLALALADAGAGDDPAWHYAGFNHRGFVYGGGWLDRLLRAIGREGTLEGIPAAVIRTLRAVPVKHMAMILADGAGEDRGRAAALAALRLRLRRELARDPERRPAALSERFMPWYGSGVLPVLRVIADPAGGRVVGTLAAPDGVPREAPLWLDAGGARAIEQPSPPPLVASWLRRLEDHERAVIAAAADPTREGVEAALRLDPLLHGAIPPALATRLLRAREVLAA